MPSHARDACVLLRDGLRQLLGSELVALWIYGAATFPDAPKRLGDVDTHTILASAPDPATAHEIDELHEQTAKQSGIEWDSWYVLERHARGSEPPPHAFRQPKLVDWAWALHRAHWLAGRYVDLHGPRPKEIVPEPTWRELVDALRDELEFLEQDAASHAAFAVWNSCRILYSLETRDVVVSKRAAAAWALRNLPDRFHVAIRAAGRIYDDEADQTDKDILASARPDISKFVHERFDRG